LAAIFELIGKTDKSKSFFEHFLRAQDEFKPDRIDEFFLEQMSFDIPGAIKLAREKVY